MPRIIGNCDEKINSFYFDINDGTCKSFVYSGCNGNLNRWNNLFIFNLKKIKKYSS